MSNISRKTFMIELKNLLSFMDGEDRDRALARYDELFSAVGEDNEDALIASFGSAVRQVLSLEKELREAQKIGVAPFMQPMPVPEEFRKDKVSSGDGAEREEEKAPAVPDGPGSFVRTAAGVLEEEGDTAEINWETISSMDEGFPMEDLVPASEDLPKTGETVFPEVQYGMPEEPAPIPEEDPIPTDVPEGQGKEPEAEETVPAAEIPEDTAAPEQNRQDSLPYAVSPGQIDDVFAGTEPIDLSSSDPWNPAAADVPETGTLEGTTVTETVIAPMTPESEPPAPETSAPAEKKEAVPERQAPEMNRSGPGAWRILAAILVTFPFIVLWIVSFAVFVALGIAVMALGFACCAAGIYLTGYVTGGKLGFMPDIMLVSGAALVLFGLALLFIWMGLWIAAGGFASVLHWTGSIYRSILKKKVPRKGGTQ